MLHREEALVARAMLRASAKAAVLTASGKLRSAGPYVVGTATEIDTLITDATRPATTSRCSRRWASTWCRCDDRRARAVTITFLLNGMIYGAWAARIPAIRDRLDLSDGQVGIALAFIAIGSLGGMPIAGRAAAPLRQPPDDAVTLRPLRDRRRERRRGAVARHPVPACAAAYGAATGSLDVAMNAHARHRRAAGRQADPVVVPRGVLDRRTARRARGRGRRGGGRRRADRSCS